jgi:phenylalanyl-tRNA synthetase beta chain
MQFSESWLRTFANPEKISTDALSHSLTMAGLEVEEVGPVAPPFTKIVVAACWPPNAIPTPTA